MAPRKKQARTRRPRIDDLEVDDRRGYGWYRINNEINDVYGPTLGPHGLAVYGSLCRRANVETDQAVVTVRQLGHDTGCSRWTVMRMIERLERLDLVEVVERYRGNDRRAHLFILRTVPPTLRADWQDRSKPDRRQVTVATLPYGHDPGSSQQPPLLQTATTLVADSNHPGSREPHLKKDSRKEDSRKEKRRGSETFDDDTVRNLAIAYVGHRCECADDDQLFREARRRGFDWSTWLKVRDTKLAKRTIRYEQLQRGVTW